MCQSVSQIKYNISFHGHCTLTRADMYNACGRSFFARLKNFARMILSAEIRAASERIAERILRSTRVDRSQRVGILAVQEYEVHLEQP